MPWYDALSYAEYVTYYMYQTKAYVNGDVKFFYFFVIFLQINFIIYLKKNG
jgi:hypothetical protein